METATKTELVKSIAELIMLTDGIGCSSGMIIAALLLHKVSQIFSSIEKKLSSCESKLNILMDRKDRVK